jgi:ketosteroid isomerase-like protein
MEEIKMKRLIKIILVFGVSVFLANVCIAGDDEDIKRELDVFWAEMSRSVSEGDFTNLTAAYHPDAVLVNGIKEASYPASKAFEMWKQGLLDTKMGKMEASVSFRFTQRLHDDNTAHETGIFHYKSNPEQGKPRNDYIHFEMLLVKQNGWKLLMEYQLGYATEEDWIAAE